MRWFFLKKSINPSNAGFTIIELLISLAIFSIGLLAMSALQSSSLLATGNVGKKTEAWTVLNNHVERLKAMRFYENDNGLDDDGDGTVDEFDETMPDLSAGIHAPQLVLGRYIVHWQVVDDLPIGPVTMPPPTDTSPQIEGAVPAGTYTVSKTISVQVTLGTTLVAVVTPPATGNRIASCQFVKAFSEGG